ncbi:hypothetical protein FRC17_007988, partial [Serendipita sp. 399]
MAYNYHHPAHSFPGYMPYGYNAVQQIPHPPTRTILREPIPLANNSPDHSFVNLMEPADSDDDESSGEDEPVPAQPPVAILRRSSVKSSKSRSQSKSRDRSKSRERTVPTVGPQPYTEQLDVSHGHPWTTEQIHPMPPFTHAHGIWHPLQHPQYYPPYYGHPGLNVAHSQPPYNPYHHPLQSMPQYVNPMPEAIVPMVPQAVAIATPVEQVYVLPEREEVSKKKQKTKEIQEGDAAPNPAWGKYASRQPLLDPSSVGAKRLGAITLHPLLCSETCRRLLHFDAIRSLGLGKLKAEGEELGLEEFLAEPASAPRLTVVRLRMEILPHIIALSNPTGVTVENVLSVIKRAVESNVERRVWDRLTDEQKQN